MRFNPYTLSIEEIEKIIELLQLSIQRKKEEIVDSDELRQQFNEYKLRDALK